MKFSLILPFRERLEMFKNMIKTVVETVDDINDIEICIAIDDDDPAGLKALELIDDYHIKMQYLIRKRSKHFTKDYINPLARNAKGRWLITVNDDSDFQTVGWDTEIHNCMHIKSREHRSDILLGLTKDEIPRKDENLLYPHFSSFPVVGREFVEATGFLQDERCMVWGPDHVLADTFRMLDKHRLVSLTHVTIGHISTHTGRRKVNENYNYFIEIDNNHRIEIGTLDHKPTIHRIREHIENKRIKR